ncbi:MAG: SIS domain-containing protein [Anaerolineales bacterium]|jgi:D-sedoheptulose 7-phosphate isomerase
MENPIRKYVIDLQKTLDLLPMQSIYDVIQVLHNARLRKQQLFVLGNGGSASTASHIVCDLAKNTRVEGVPPIRILDMIDNSAVFSAYANDEGYENVFAQHLSNFANSGDVVIGISTSGESPNVLRAIDRANQLGAVTIGFTGFDGGQLLGLASMNIHIESDNIEQVEDIHLILGHIITVNLRNLAVESVSKKNGQYAAVNLF